MPEQKIAIEDYFEDILGKALRGLGLSEQDLCARAGIFPRALRSLMEGVVDEAALRKVAPCLNLDAGKLVVSANKSWYPEAEAPEGLACVNTPYHDMRVNAYVVWDPASRRAALFDTGADAGGLLSIVAKRDLSVEHVFLTHAHADHVADLDRVRLACPAAPVWSGRKEAAHGARFFDEGESFAIGALGVETRLTWGHSPGGITYVISGLARPVAIVGDAVFAGSMGGGKVSYDDALTTNRDKILSLPGETVLCPGHGPLTSVEEERRHNPFF